MLESCGGTCIIGGLQTFDQAGRYLSPTVVVEPRRDSQMMQEEIFGPILPILTYENFEEVIKFINSGDKPLSVYYAGNPGSKHFKRLVDETSSGNISANDVLTHTMDFENGFGGVGASGYGRVGGYESFKRWSNAKSIISK